MKNTPKATIDFETRSACSLKKSGTWRYALDPSTEVLCLAFRLPSWKAGRTALWHPGYPLMDEVGPADPVDELFDWIASDKLVEAHGAWFERSVWLNQMMPRYQFPMIRGDQWRCSGAKAASHALPRGLDAALSALGSKVSKAEDGHKVMMKMTKPRKPLKKELTEWGIIHGICKPCVGYGKIKIGRAKAVQCAVCQGRGYVKTPPAYPRIYHESAEMFANLFFYCRQDVLAEEALSAAVPDLSPSETAIYLVDQTVNERGFRLDRTAVESALKLIAEENRKGLIELKALTKGEVEKPTQRDRMMRWFQDQNFYLPNTQKQTLEDALATQHMTADVRRALELILSIGKSSTAKYVAMQNHISPEDDRVRGGLLYHGAATGRWSGSGIQPHNFPKGHIKDMELAWEILNTLDAEFIEAYSGDVMEMLAGSLRGAIVPSPGNELFVADFASIEARVLLWIADDEVGLELFRTGGDIYLDMAGAIYKYECNKKDHPKERALGKVAILGLGYQMGPGKFVSTALLMGKVVIEEDTYCEVCGEPSKRHDFVKPRHAFEGDLETMTAVKVVDAYRERYWRVVDQWNGQEAAAIEAVANPGSTTSCGYIRWKVEGKFLYCILPSGRRLAYPDPEIISKRLPWGKEVDALSYMGINVYNHQWERQDTYGGKLVENIVQAIARDLMAEAMLRCEMSDIYSPILSVHDEMLAEAPVGKGSVHEFEQLMAECPPWAPGCPIGAEGWKGMRYRK